PGHSLWVGAGALLLGLAIGFRVFGASRTANLLPLGLLTVLGYLSLHPWVAPPDSPHDVRHFISRQEVEIQGTLVAAPLADGQRIRTVLRVERIKRAAGWEPLEGRVRLSIRGRLPLKLNPGDRIGLAGKLRAIRNFANPGGFDYQRFMAWQGIHATLYARAGRVAVIHQAAPKGWRPFNALRQRVQGIILQLPPARAGADAQALLGALLLGNREGIPGDLRQAFARTGTAHLLAISGLHMGMVAGASFWILKLLLGLNQHLVLLARARKIAALGAILVVSAYGILAGLAPSTQRALAMAALALTALVVEREVDLFNLMAWAALVILVWHPPALFTLSFQLSFAAVFWIVFGLRQGRRISLLRPGPGDRPSALSQRLLRWVALSLWVTLLATLGTLPLIIQAFNQVSLVGLGCNLLLVPLVGWVVLPLGLLGLGTAWISAPLCAWFVQAAALPLKLICLFVRGIGGLSWAALHTVSFSIVEIGCYYLLLGAGLVWLGTQRRNPGKTSVPVWRCPRRLAAILGGFALAVALVDAGYWSHRRFWTPDLRMTMLDVGQGTAVVVEAPGGDVMLVDGGGFADSASFDVGARLLAPFLWQRKIASVNTLVLTHPNSDHLNGLIYIAEHFRVQEFWSNGQGADTLGYRTLRRVLDRRGVTLRTAFSGDELPRLGQLKRDILYPPRGFLRRAERGPWKDANNNSLVLKLTHGTHTILLTGDIMAAAERELVAHSGQQLLSSVLVVPHHGSRSSCTTEFVDRVRPEYALISCGWQNHYRFPHPTVVSRLKRYSRHIFRTDLHGAVGLRSDGRHLFLQGTREAVVSGDQRVDK
ncbi:MAG: DNA internalization-related competence protein ComEC/Rec2, partial [Desulfobacterales bacterium]